MLMSIERVGAVQSGPNDGGLFGTTPQTFAAWSNDFTTNFSIGSATATAGAVQSVATAIGASNGAAGLIAPSYLAGTSAWSGLAYVAQGSGSSPEIIGAGRVERSRIAVCLERQPTEQFDGHFR